MITGSGGVTPRLRASLPREADGLGQYIITASGRPWPRCDAHLSAECHDWTGPRRRIQPSWRGWSPSRGFRLGFQLVGPFSRSGRLGHCLGHHVWDRGSVIAVAALSHGDDALHHGMNLCGGTECQMVEGRGVSMARASSSRHVRAPLAIA